MLHLFIVVTRDRFLHVLSWPISRGTLSRVLRTWGYYCRRIILLKLSVKGILRDFAHVARNIWLETTLIVYAVTISCHDLIHLRHFCWLIYLASFKHLTNRFLATSASSSILHRLLRGLRFCQDWVSVYTRRWRRPNLNSTTSRLEASRL